MKLQTIVTSVEDVAEGIRAFVLEAPDGRALPPWEPGAHVSVLMLPGGRAVVRAYSLTGDPADRGRYRIAVQREAEGGGGSRFMHDAVRPGMRMVISAPGNAFPLRRTDGPVELLAGGIGVTPFVPMAHALLAAGADVRLTVLVRSDGRVPFREALRAALGERLAVLAGLDVADSRAAIADVAARAAARGADLYHCGPPAFAEAVAESAAAAGVPGSRVFSERFVNPGQLGPGRAFRIRLARSGETCDVPAGVSALDALASRLGLHLPYDCRSGYCGTCVQPVAAGAPEHRDTCLSAAQKAAGRSICLCVSRAAGDELVLDL